MRIGSLLVKDWRNLREFEITLDERMNLFWGPNGAGKTNLLEALCVLATLKSFRESPWPEIPRWGCKVAVVGARVEGRGGASWMRAQVDEEGRRFFLDGQPTRDFGRYFETLRAVVFTPSDVGIPRGAPELRRRFMDRAAFNADPSHLGRVRSFRRALAQKGALLREGLRGRPRLREELRAWNEKLLGVGVELSLGRRRIVEAISVPLSNLHLDMTGGRPLLVRYRGALGSGAEKELVASYRNLLESAEDDECRRGLNLVGPQRDDLDIRLWDGSGSPREEGPAPPLEEPILVDSKRSQPLDPRWRSARAFGSQGQLRTLALALRLAEFEVAASGEHEAPLLLLDDLSSELDHGRMERLVRHLETLRCQIAMSTTDPSIITRFGRGSIRAFRVAEGMVAGPPSPG